ncbi:phosphotransferase enzyme family protein [Niabella insulamsoli]|uniref:phosphotransferase enzyme family protein n=1 Tax=Niabella insulamsoli TaxID=3144874 RepID=UPI0031FD3D9C
MHHVLARYGFDKDNYTVEKFGSGLINETCVVKNGKEKYILQKVNEKVFVEPLLIADNLEKIENHLSQTNADYYFTNPQYALDGKSMVHVDGGYYRIFPFVKNSKTLDVVQTAGQAYEAARQFGKFTKVLSAIDISSLNITLPSFHDLSLRYHQFQKALEEGNQERLKEVSGLVDQLKKHSDIVEEFVKIRHSDAFKLRVTHHDTKISNVLFDEHDKGICVIDLDTVMPGYFISDVGDMMRTYLCPVSEEEKDFDQIEIRDEFYIAIVDGYKAYMEDELTAEERQYFFYAGKFMIYMQALRFLTDYINNDIYYGSRYPGHNLVRATNQATLLKRLIEKEHQLSTYA